MVALKSGEVLFKPTKNPKPKTTITNIDINRLKSCFIEENMYFEKVFFITTQSPQLVLDVH